MVVVDISYKFMSAGWVGFAARPTLILGRRRARGAVRQDKGGIKMKLARRCLRYATLVVAIAAVGFVSCKKELPSIKVEKADGVMLNYSSDVVTVLKGTDTVRAGDMIAAGTELTIVPLKGEAGAKPRTFVSVKVNDGGELVGSDKTKVSYRVQSGDKVISIMAQCVGGFRELEYDPKNVLVYEKIKNRWGNILPSGARLKVGQEFFITSFDEETPFGKLLINGVEMPAGYTALGSEYGVYTVQATDQEVVIKAQYAAAPASVTLTFGATVKVAGKSTGDAVNVGEALTITPAEAGKVFDELKVNGNAIAAAAGQESYAYTVQAGDTEVKIEATVKAVPAATITLTFGATVKVDGKTSGDVVNVGDALTISPAESGKVFDELKVNGNAIAAAANQASYVYTVQASDTAVAIEATVK